MLLSVVGTAVKGNWVALILYLWAVTNMSGHWQDIIAFVSDRYSWCGVQSAWHAWLM